MRTVSLFIFFSIFIALNSTAQSITELTIGKTIEFESSFLNETRKLNIYLPSDFDSTKKYSVIYLLDGSIDEDFIHVAGLIQFFDMTFEIPQIIVVGIANVDRKRDFTFVTQDTSLQREFPSAGHSDKFIQFIEKELQPFIGNQFKVNEQKMLIGQSLGGLLATEILLKRPQLFTKYFITSPSLWWDNHSLLLQTEKYLLNESSNTPDVYIAVGKDEDKIMIRDAKTFYKKIKKHSSLGKVVFNLMPNENHATILHNSLYQGFLTYLKK
jgi:predicted alpha/beta superfamily hydrolase